MPPHPRGQPLPRRVPTPPPKNRGAPATRLRRRPFRRTPALLAPKERKTLPLQWREQVPMRRGPIATRKLQCQQRRRRAPEVRLRRGQPPPSQRRHMPLQQSRPPPTHLGQSTSRRCCRRRPRRGVQEARQGRTTPRRTPASPSSERPPMSPRQPGQPPMRRGPASIRKLHQHSRRWAPEISPWRVPPQGTPTQPPPSEQRPMPPHRPG
mmetsp:Transcript_61804/g.179281  ORF Transcript_61804/g.179281 Transcript_61804/m.179281 type:complete len:209 (+) Transcript_61804:280-906(+)